MDLPDNLEDSEEKMGSKVTAGYLDGPVNFKGEQNDAETMFYVSRSLLGPIVLCHSD